MHLQRYKVTKTGARFEPGPTHCYPVLQLTELRGKLTKKVQIRTINEKLFSLFISKWSKCTSHNGGVPFPRKMIPCLIEINPFYFQICTMIEEEVYYYGFFSNHFLYLKQTAFGIGWHNAPGLSCHLGADILVCHPRSHVIYV